MNFFVTENTFCCSVTGCLCKGEKVLVFKELFLLVSWLPNATWRRCHFFFLWLFLLIFSDFLGYHTLHGGDVTFSMVFPFDFLRFSRLPNVKQQSNYLFLLKIILRKRTKKRFASIVDFKQKKENNSKNESLGP